MLETLRQLRAVLTVDERRQWLGLLPLAALAVLLEAVINQRSHLGAVHHDRAVL